MLLSCRRKRINTLGVSDGQQGKAGMFAQPQCSVSQTAFQRHFFSSPDVPEEDANELILILQNCQVLSKEPNRMSSSPVSLLSDGECLYCQESRIRGELHNKIYAVYLFQTRHFSDIIMQIILTRFIFSLVVAPKCHPMLQLLRPCFTMFLEMITGGSTSQMSNRKSREHKQTCPDLLC